MAGRGSSGSMDNSNTNANANAIPWENNNNNNNNGSSSSPVKGSHGNTSPSIPTSPWTAPCYQIQAQRNQVLKNFQARMGVEGGENVLVYPNDGKSAPIPSVLYLEGRYGVVTAAGPALNGNIPADTSGGGGGGGRAFFGSTDVRRGDERGHSIASSANFPQSPISEWSEAPSYAVSSSSGMAVSDIAEIRTPTYPNPHSISQLGLSARCEGRDRIFAVISMGCSVTVGALSTTQMSFLITGLKVLADSSTTVEEKVLRGKQEYTQARLMALRDNTTPSPLISPASIGPDLVSLYQSLKKGINVRTVDSRGRAREKVLWLYDDNDINTTMYGITVTVLSLASLPRLVLSSEKEKSQCETTMSRRGKDRGKHAQNTATRNDNNSSSSSSTSFREWGMFLIGLDTSTSTSSPSSTFPSDPVCGLESVALNDIA
eukprot:gene11496-24033_t